MKKGKKDNAVLFIDASNEYQKATNSNKLSDENVDNIVEIFTKREDKQYIAKLVTNEEIGNQDYNLSVSTYVEKEDTREKIDIEKLNEEIEEVVAIEQKLREGIDEIIAEIEV